MTHPAKAPGTTPGAFRMPAQNRHGGGDAGTMTNEPITLHRAPTPKASPSALATMAATRNLLDLMADGTVWPDAHLDIRDGVITIYPPRGHMLREPDLIRHADVLESFARHFPVGRHRKDGGRTSGGVQGRPLVDRWEYQARVVGVLVSLAYYKPHVHESYTGHVGQDGKPEWRCTGCRRRITITEARRLGLLPALNRKNRHTGTEN